MNRISKRIKAGALAVFAAAGAVSAANCLICYALKVNGETVGTARSLYSIQQAVDNTEERLTDTLGYEYSLDTQVTAVFADQVMDVRELEEEIIHNIPDVSLLWAINVDGETVGACATKSEAEGIIQGILDMYVTDDTQMAKFLQDVKIQEMYVSKDTIQNPGEISRLLNPLNKESKYALSVITTRQEDELRITPCDVEYYDTANLYEGEYQVTDEGVDMEELVTVSVEYLNGEEVFRTDLERETVVQAMSQQVARGTTPRPATASYGVYIWPAEGVISSDFGYRTVSVGSSNHKGIDIAGETDSEILAADGGEVIFAGDGDGYGNLVKIRHDNGTVTYYAHCNALCVNEGERVARGQVIAYMGSTGVSTGTHLHFEVRVNDVAQDPVDYLP